ncbi:hypothetical protein [Rhizobium leguminosarum]|uniref:hypothetical protein n=1 Tax=Rhizobium leguminosarum TaxID=384 RepID=UPI003D092FA0
MDHDISISMRLQSAEAEETQNREHDNDSADKPDQIVHGEPFSCLASGQLWPDHITVKEG